MQASVNRLALYVAMNSQIVPAFPVGIIAIVVCNIRKRSEFGGLAAVFLLAAVLRSDSQRLPLYRDFQTYVPENFASHPATHRWLMAASVSTIVILALQVTVATLLIVVRSWDMLQLLRILLIAKFVANLGALVVDVSYFPNSVPFRVGALLSLSFSSAYFFLSERVRHVFKVHDWETAVETIHPMPKELSIY